MAATITDKGSHSLAGLEFDHYTMTADAATGVLKTSDAVALTTVTNATTLLTSAALFGSVTVGMAIQGTGIPTGTSVRSIADTSNLTMTQAATDSTSTSRTFRSNSPPEPIYLSFPFKTTGSASAMAAVYVATTGQFTVSGLSAADVAPLTVIS